MIDFDDEYATCHHTFVTLCLYPEGPDPAAITERLGIEPTSWQRKGELDHRTDGPRRIATIDG